MDKIYPKMYGEIFRKIQTNRQQWNRTLAYKEKLQNNIKCMMRKHPSNGRVYYDPLAVLAEQQGLKWEKDDTDPDNVGRLVIGVDGVGYRWRLPEAWVANTLGLSKNVACCVIDTCVKMTDVTYDHANVANYIQALINEANSNMTEQQILESGYNRLDAVLKTMRR